MYWIYLIDLLWALPFCDTQVQGLSSLGTQLLVALGASNNVEEQHAYSCHN